MAKNLNGRPTKFKSSYIEDIVKFFDVEPYRKELMEKSTEYTKEGGIKKESEKYRIMPNKMPTLFGFARKIGVNYSNVWRWTEKAEEEATKAKIDKAILEGKTDSKEFKYLTDLQKFRKAFNEAKELQKEFLISIGLAGAAPPAFAIFTAKNVTDMRDKVESDVTMRLPKPLLEAIRQKDAVPNNNSNKETISTDEEN